jgi:hypothetical protein
MRVAFGAPPSVMFQHNLDEGDARLAQAQAMARAAFTVTPGAPAAAPKATRILEVIR